MTEQDFTDYIDRIGDRTALYQAVASHTGARRVLYPGSYLDLVPSHVWPDVTYLDADARARKAFQGPDATTLATRHKHYAEQPRIAFVPGDYTRTLAELPAAEWDLVISLYAGPVSEHAPPLPAPRRLAPGQQPRRRRPRTPRPPLPARHRPSPPLRPLPPHHRRPRPLPAAQTPAPPHPRTTPRHRQGHRLYPPGPRLPLPPRPPTRER